MAQMSASSVGCALPMRRSDFVGNTRVRRSLPPPEEVSHETCEASAAVELAGSVEQDAWAADRHVRSIGEHAFDSLRGMFATLELPRPAHMRIEIGFEVELRACVARVRADLDLRLRGRDAPPAFDRSTVRRDRAHGARQSLTEDSPVAVAVLDSDLADPHGSPADVVDMHDELGIAPIGIRGDGSTHHNLGAIEELLARHEGEAGRARDGAVNSDSRGHCRHSAERMSLR